MQLDSVTEFIRARTSDRVCDGPFAGMKISFNVPWQQMDKPSKLLGTYEQETHDFINSKSGPQYDCVVDIGCSEGYLAIGLAMRNPMATVFAYDTNDVAKTICTENAILNQLTERIVVGDFCDSDRLINHIETYNRSFVLCDCEGYEDELFASTDTCWALSSADMLIELHDFMRPGIKDRLVHNLSVSHNVSIRSSGSRDPNKLPFMQGLSEQDRWRAVCEFRPVTMTWLLCESKCPKVIRHAAGEKKGSQ